MYPRYTAGFRNVLLQHHRGDKLVAVLNNHCSTRRPGDTFVSLAAVMSFYFIFRGSFDIAMAFAASRAPGWWVLLLVGLAEIAIGFWAAGSWKVSAVVLVSWVAAGALMHGIGQISTAFLVRRVGHRAAALD